MKKTTILDTLGSGINDPFLAEGEVAVLVAPVPVEQLLETLDPELQARIVELDELLEPDPPEHDEQ
ncbi:MAG: hypothetical protein GY913_23645 [Proteobacteria bacterium]|nr:hypothetical protein [Pseudomonadota bacterium]MCP4919908.1 hypothetical protein [Pseudomonadota bacterium]